MAKSIRDAYGEALLEYGGPNKDVVVLDADLSGSTKSAVFQKAYPERFFNVGIAEANMTAIAAGLACVGKVPFVNTFTTFLTTLGLLAVRTYCSYARIPVKLMGGYAGMSDSFDGPTHHALEDISAMRALPGMKVYVASDATIARWLTFHAAEVPSPVYLRLSREPFPDVYPEGEAFEDGVGKVVREGNDATVIACGIMTGRSLAAADILAKEGIYVRVVDMFTIKPLDAGLVLDSAAKTGAIVTAEEHNVIGGLGSAVCEALCEGAAKAPVTRVGMRDTHGETGPYHAILDKYGLSAEGVAAAVRETLHKKLDAAHVVH